MAEMDQNANYPVFEVFVQRDANNQFVHHGSLLAPNKEIALSLAKENFTRRQPCYNIWVVQREHVAQLSPEERKSLDRLDGKQYRETKGYGYLKKKWRKYDQDQLTERNLLK